MHTLIAIAQFVVGLIASWLPRLASSYLLLLIGKPSTLTGTPSFQVATKKFPESKRVDIRQVLSDSKVLVIGGTHGIGRSLVLVLSKRGYSVLYSGILPVRLTRIAGRDVDASKSINVAASVNDGRIPRFVYCDLGNASVRVTN
jgi:anti-sigma factor RsiW